MDRVAVLALASLVGALWFGPALSQPRLPNWSGTWLPDIATQYQEEDTNLPPWTPQAAARIARQTADLKAGHPWGLFTDCLPEGMPTWMLISHSAIEILLTPGRITMLGEADGNHLRRIHTDGHRRPDDPDPSFHGDSVGRWEGQTLIVDTVAILPEVVLAIGEARGVPNGGDMHVVERLRLTSADVLTDDLQITAPHVLSRPWTTTRRFRRERGPAAEIEEGVCRRGDFTEAKDADGFSVFSPAKTVSGNMVAPPSTPASRDKAQ